MPHLDEGALWVRATMPYTISFEEASKISPQIRDILLSYPQVTVVGSELGRPDDGTDPTGFFNCEFYVGLKPYKDKAWHGDVSNKPELIESINKKLSAFPGIIFNYTQPAEDAVDEALTGLKSALAVKIYGDDLNVLQDKAIQIKNILTKVPGFTELMLADRMPKRRLLIVTQALMAIPALGLLAVTATGVVAPWMVFLAVFSMGLVNAVDNPTRQSFVIEMVGSDRLVNAVSLNSVIVQSANRLAGGRRTADRRLRRRSLLCDSTRSPSWR